MFKVLIAEDDLSTRYLLKNALESVNCSVIQASNGRVAIDILKDNPDLSLAVVDVEMPEVDGRSFIKFVRNESKAKELPIIIVSGIVGPHQISELLEHGASRFLPKPVKAEDLRGYALRLMKIREPQTETRDTASTSLR